MKRPNLTHHRGSFTGMSDTAQRLDELAAMDMAAARQALMLKMRHEADLAKRPAPPAPPEADTG